ncbi:LysM peptidoglycan-binding domain-containing protein [Psychrobacter sp. PP-21]|uniref:LysM peptidoglycan-binding domain-containing protein n=1 Tax=Psychrobacter sp. PP-21 TaxID=2957503 RepID=UPI0029A265A2|nr:LysM peptidoglycan-binding domain-containing protein [Psychrobacter sp. PP-21]MDX2374360.1 LysM peptidoglycan-binding domain-containing protein [Psychrobacter sp. PP-21]
MNFSRQALLGIGMILGGSVMLYAMVQQIGESNQPEPATAMIEKPSVEEEAPQPLTTDIETEKRILAQKQKERAARVAEQERRAKEFLTEQEVAEAEALAKARAESQQYVQNIAATSEQTDDSADATNTQSNATSKEVQDADKLIKAADDAVKEAQAKKQQEAQEQAAAKKLAESKKEAEAKRQAEAKKQAEVQAAAEKKREAAEAAKNEPPKSSSDYQVKKGDGLIKLARQYNMPVEVLAQANNISPSTSLQLGQEITIPSRSQVQRLEREAVAAEQAREKKREQEEALAKKSADAKRDAQQKLSEARKEVKETDAKGSFGVQVALADNQAKADQLAKKFQSAGYQVKTSPTSRGVRVVVGPERGKVAALALKDKINSDPNVNTTSAWVLYWR